MKHIKLSRRIAFALVFSLLAAVALTGTAAAATPLFDTTEFFTERDLEQEPDLTNAVYYTLADDGDIEITAAGVYVLSGEAANVTVTVEAGSKDKVQLVLDGVSITNEDFPCIYVKDADKVFVTTIADSTLSVTGTFIADGETNTDGVIYSRVDITLNGTAALTIVSTDNGVVCKDDLKVTGGSYDITSAKKCLEANDSIRICGGTFDLKTYTDGIHAENSKDDTLGYVYISGGDFMITARDDGIHAVSAIQIDGGNITISAAEGIEATYIQINDGTITISASDDGINGTKKSTVYTPTVEFNGGYTTINMSSGDTDGVDANGYIIVNDATVDVSGSSTFDFDFAGTINGGTVIVNGEVYTGDTLPNQFGNSGSGGGPGGW